MIGGLLAGLLCVWLCPDDPSHWRTPASAADVSIASSNRNPKDSELSKKYNAGSAIICN